MLPNRIPRPAALSKPPGLVHIGRDYVWLSPVVPNRFRIAGMLDRIEHAQELRRPLHHPLYGPWPLRSRGGWVYWPPSPRTPGGYPLM